MVNIDEINARLKDYYGTNLAGDPIFRVVFSDDQLEKRYGQFTEWAGKIFIRELTAIREVPKYWWIKHAWILERWAPPSMVYDPRIIGSNSGSYEPVQVFQHENGTPVPVTDKICHEIIWNLFHIPLPGDAMSKMRTQEEKEFNKEVELNKLHLEEVGSAMIKDGESII